GQRACVDVEEHHEDRDRPGQVHPHRDALRDKAGLRLEQLANHRQRHRPVEHEPALPEDQGEHHQETTEHRHAGHLGIRFATCNLTETPRERVMIKLGVLDFDTSHVVEFTRRINHVGIKEDQWVDGAKVVIGCPGESKIMPERIEGYTKQMKEFGVPLVDRPEEMIGKVDGMLIESQEGTPHYERARPFLEAGIPCYIDKPFTCSVDHARKIIDLAEQKKVPVFSSSSLRYAPELVAFMKDEKKGKVLGALAYGPASEHERNPGLFHYGIHAVEILYTLMGPGCDRVSCVYEKGAEVTTGHWKDGRLASVRGIRAG